MSVTKRKPLNQRAVYFVTNPKKYSKVHGKQESPLGKIFFSFRY